MNLLQNLHLVVIEYLYRGRRAVPLQTFTTRHSIRKLSIVMVVFLLDSNRKLSIGPSYGFVKHFYATCPVNYQIRQNNAK